jgi:hypothetical protein
MGEEEVGMLLVTSYFTCTVAFDLSKHVHARACSGGVYVRRHATFVGIHSNTRQDMSDRTSERDRGSREGVREGGRDVRECV